MKQQGNQVDAPVDSKHSKRYIKLIQAIGKGTFGTVYRAEYTIQQLNENNELFLKTKEVAVKKTQLNPKFKNREIQIMSKLNQKNLIKMIDEFKSLDCKLKETIKVEKVVPKNNMKIYSYLIMEYVPKTLSSILRQNKMKHSYLNFNQILNFLKSLLTGVSYIHSQNICHRDIKPSNILIDQQNNNQLKICDFGSAKQLLANQKSITYICSRYYRAPQLILDCKNYSTKIDMWSIGCLLMQMFTNVPIFDGSNNMNQIAKIIKILGTPSKEDFQAMEVQDQELSELIIQVQPIGIQNWIIDNRKQINLNQLNLAVQIVSNLLVYDPNKRKSGPQILNLLQTKGI